MSRRKRNNALPERLVNGRIRQLSWNMTSYNRLGGVINVNDHIFVPSSSNKSDIDMRSNQSCSTEIQNDDSTSQGEANTNDTFYKLRICNELYVNSSTKLLGSLLGVFVRQDCLETADRLERILESSTVIKVVEDSVYGVSSKTFDENLNISKGFVKVIATYEQIDGLAYLQKKGIVEVVADFDDLVNQSQCKLMVYLNETGFTTINVPSEDPSMGKNHKCMKILMQWLYGLCLPDKQHQPNKHYDNQIESIFETLKSKQTCPSSSSVNESTLTKEQSNLDKFQHPSLVPLLRAYQKRAVHWMIEQETLDTKAFAAENKIPHPLWETISLGEKQACYNPYTGRMSRNQIYHQGYPSGGILADEMGLGKTVEVLACILNHPRKSEIEMGHAEEILQAEANTYPKESLSCTMAETDEKGGSIKYLNAVDNHQVSLEKVKTIQVEKRQEQSFHFPEKAESQLCEESKGNDLKSDFLPSRLPSLKEMGGSNTQSAIKKTNVGRWANESNKRSLPLDPDVHVDKHVKKAKIFENSNGSSLYLNVHEQSPIFKETIQPYVFKSSLPSGTTIFNTIVDENTGIMESKNFLIHSADDANDKINYEVAMGDITKEVDAEVPNNGHTKNLTASAINDFVLDGIQKVQSFEYLSERELSTVNVEEEKPVRCICGKEKAGRQEDVLTCTNCCFSQHPKCIGLVKATEENYVCPDCSLKMPLLESNTTLIVSPVTIAHQWLDEIHRHILPGSLNVMIYEGVAKQGFVYPSVLAENDIILTTYEVLKRDFHHLSSKKDNHNYRRPKRYSTWPCPLTGVKFWRICLDEAQMVENTTAKTTETALHLSGIHRWCITGTPIQKTIDDLYGLFLFLGVDPYYRKAWWKKLLYEPFMEGDTKPLGDALYNIMWRTAKKDVINEINLPEQKESMNWLNFSPVEYHFYRRQFEECSRYALKELNKFHESETELNSLDRYSVHRVLWPLLKLRQACCHPQAVRGGYLAVQKDLITMDQLLQSLINKAKNESQDAHRLFLCALNGLAGTYILQENWQSAVDVYREAMASWKEHEELFKTDTLQKLHTLHNLHEVLSKFNSNSRTLRDDFLEQEASEIKNKYLQKWKDQLKVAESEASAARNVHEALKLKVDFKCPWWMTYLQNIIDSENKILGDKSITERLVHKVKSDLAAVTNQQEYGSLSMADSFSDLRGLQLLLVQKFDAIEDCQNSLFRELKSLMIEPTKEMVVAAAECCLRPAINNTAKSCCFCQTNDVMSVYESLIFGHQGMSNNDAESIGGLRAETEAVRTLKSIYTFLKSQSKHHDKWHHELQQQAQCHLEYLDLIRKNFKVYRQLWHALRQRVSALDELEMCTMRLRLRYPGEVIEDNQLYIIEPTEVESTQMGFRSDKALSLSSLRKSLGQLLYLKNLAKTQSTDDGENSEPCPVCTKVLGYQWSVFSCGHCLCCQCMWVLLERPGIPGRAGSYVRCPMCRANTMVQDISYVSTVRQLTEEDKDLIVQGSHSTKIEAAVRTLMKIQRTDSQAKTLVFSTWQDVLDVIARALTENNMKFRSIKKSKDFQSNLEEFKTSNDISILLIPLQSGSNGLNIIEATHVILVEPSLNPSLERQAVGRIHRIGQTKPTFIHRLLIANTVEENIIRFLQNRADSGQRWGTRRTDGENIPLTVGELASFFQPTESQIM